MAFSLFSRNPRKLHRKLSPDAPRLVEQEPCRKCGSTRVHRSKSRNAYERLRKLYTRARPFQCHACGWRGWLQPLQCCEPMSGAAVAPRPVDLAALDQMFGGPAAAAAAQRQAERLESGDALKPDSPGDTFTR